MFQLQRGANQKDFGLLYAISVSEEHNSFQCRSDAPDGFLGALAVHRKGACPRPHHEWASDIRPMQVPKVILSFLRSQDRLDQPRRQFGQALLCSRSALTAVTPMEMNTIDR
jgi:hypothetical protein